MKSSRYRLVAGAVAARRDDAHGEGVPLGEHPAITARHRAPVDEHPARPVLRDGGRDRDLRLQAEVDLIELHPDMGPYPARAAVRADDRPREHRLATGQHHGDRPPVGHGGTVLLDPHHRRTGAQVGPGLLRLLDQTGVELRAVDEPEEHATGATGARQLAVEREGDRVDAVLQGQFEPRRQGVPRESDDSPAAGLVARQFRFLQQQDSPARHGCRVRRRCAGRTGADHDDVPHGRLFRLTSGVCVLAAHDVLLLLIRPVAPSCSRHPTARSGQALLWEDRP